MDRILLIFGTRPELIKLAPIIAAFEKRNLRNRLFILHTRQHDDLVNADLKFFRIIPDAQLEWQRFGNSLSEMTGSILVLMDQLWPKGMHHFKAVLAQGDTCSTYCASLFAFYNKIPFIHVEAGLRTNDIHDPFPEEYYRKAIALITSIHFAPTQTDKLNLLREGISEEQIYVTGNTLIDHLRLIKRHDDAQNLVVITMHRRENQEGYIQLFLKQLVLLAERHPLLHFMWLTHPGVVLNLDDQPASNNLSFHAPVAFYEMLKCYQKTCLVFTDSGGMQEEAAFLGIPVIVLRKRTERIEGTEDGIFEFADREFSGLDDCFQRMLKIKLRSPNTVYGDGYASHRIMEILSQKFESCFTPVTALEMIS